MPTATERLNEPVDGAGLHGFRVLFGTLMAFAAVRFVALGWVEELLVAPAWHAPYAGFEWVRPASAPVLYAVFGLMAASALALAFGPWPRRAAAVFLGCFGYVELLDATLYLNHYYLVTLLAILLVVLPTAGRVPRWVVWAFRIQVGAVYVWAGVAKLNPDWLFEAQPLHTWLGAFAHFPGVGPLLGERWVAFAMSWFGAAFDLTIPFFLLWRRTRGLAYAVAVVFHVSIWLLFPVGIFSWLMLVSATVFFDPSWPRRWRSWFARIPGAKASLEPADGTGRLPSVWAARLVAVWLVVQVLLPARAFVYPGNVLWTEEGFRFSWRVMLVEKTGRLELCVESGGERWRVDPRRELTRRQAQMVEVQPDLIVAFAREVADRAEARTGQPAAVRACTSRVTLNGRRSRPLIDPSVDLSKVSRGVAPSDWLEPGP